MGTTELRPDRFESVEDRGGDIASSQTGAEGDRLIDEPVTSRSSGFEASRALRRRDDVIAVYRSLIGWMLRSLERAAGDEPEAQALMEDVMALDRSLHDYATRPSTGDPREHERELAHLHETTARITDKGAAFGWLDPSRAEIPPPASEPQAPPRAPAPVPVRAPRSRLQRTLDGAPASLRRFFETCRDVWLLWRTPLFDRKFYRRRYPEIGLAHPVWHYYRFGASERRDPNPFFSTSYYLEHNPDVARSGVNPFVHFLRRGAREGRDPSLLFETRHYLSLNPDVGRSGWNPLFHYVRHGVYEGRVAMSSPKIQSLIGPYLRGTRSSCMEYLTREPDIGARRPATDLRVGVYCNTGGNYFYRDIRDLIVSGLRARGVDVAPLDESSAGGDRTHHIIVAPQEFFYLGQGQRWTADRRIDDAILVSADQPHTPWFSRCLPYLFRAKLVLDINYQVAATLRDLGVPAHFFPLGPLEGFSKFDDNVPLPDEAALASLPRDVRETSASARVGHRSPRLSFEERPIDLLFVATLNPRREAFLANNAATLSRHHTFLHLVSGSAPPLVEGRSAQLSSNAIVGLCQRSKILLNVHRDDVRYFEWHRIAMLGLWQGALVITERSFRVPWLEPGKHYLEANLDEIAELADWTLRSPEGRRRAAEVSASGHRALRKHYAFERVIDRAVQYLL